MEAAVLLLLAAALGLPGALRWLALGLLGPAALVAAVAWLMQADLAAWHGWALGLVGATLALAAEQAWLQHRR